MYLIVYLDRVKEKINNLEEKFKYIIEKKVRYIKE